MPAACCCKHHQCVTPSNRTNAGEVATLLALAQLDPPSYRYEFQRHDMLRKVDSSMLGVQSSRAARSAQSSHIPKFGIWACSCLCLQGHHRCVLALGGHGSVSSRSRAPKLPPLGSCTRHGRYAASRSGRPSSCFAVRSLNQPAAVDGLQRGPSVRQESGAL